MVDYSFNLDKIKQSLVEDGKVNTLMKIYLLVCVECARFEKSYYKRPINTSNLLDCIKHAPGSFAEFIDVMSNITKVKNTINFKDGINSEIIHYAEKYSQFACKGEDGKCYSDNGKKACEIATKILDNNNEFLGVKDYSAILDSVCSTFSTNDGVDFSKFELERLVNCYLNEGVDAFSRHSFKRNPRVQTVQVQKVEMEVPDETLPKHLQDFFPKLVDIDEISYERTSGRDKILPLDKSHNYRSNDYIKEMLENTCTNLLCGLSLLEENRKQK